MRRHVGWSGTTRRAFLDLAERVAQLARTDAAHFAFHVFGIDVLGAVPVDCVPEAEDFVRIRWPQLQALIADRRTRFLRGLPTPASPENTARLRFA